MFFAYSFLGYLLECLVLSIDHRSLVYNRGFVRHLPFCIIYGFGALAGYALLQPYRQNILLLFVAGAFFATLFEYMVARLQIYLFGSFWWDYSQKPFNFQGILCLESTIGWGLAAIVVVRFMHGAVVDVVRMVPQNIAQPLALVLLFVYAADFLHCAQKAGAERRQQNAGAEFELFSNNKNEKPR